MLIEPSLRSPEPCFLHFEAAVAKITNRSPVIAKFNFSSLLLVAIFILSLIN